MSDFPRMLFKANGVEPMHGGMFDTFIVEDADTMNSALSDGWCLTTCGATALAQIPACVDAVVVDNSPPTRDELKRIAGELGIVFDGRISNSQLQAKISEAMKA